MGGQPLNPLTGVADAGHRAMGPAAGPEAAVAEVGQRRLARDDAEAGGVTGGQPLVAGQLGAPFLVLLQPSATLGRLRRPVAGVAVAVAGDLPRLGLQDRGGQAFQEHAVVGDGEHRAPVRQQLGLQPLERPVVQVVGSARPGAAAPGGRPGPRPGRGGSAHRRRGCRAGAHGGVPAGRDGAGRCPPGGRRRSPPGPRNGRGARRRRRVPPGPRRPGFLPGPVQLGLQGAQVREGQVDGVLDGGGRGQGRVWGR